MEDDKQVYCHDTGKYYHTIKKLLPWQKRGLMYTATGYGKKIPTTRMVKYNNRLYRLYCCIFSNIGTCYIIINKKHVIMEE